LALIGNRLSLMADMWRK